MFILSMYLGVLRCHPNIYRQDHEWWKNHVDSHLLTTCHLKVHTKFACSSYCLKVFDFGWVSYVILTCTPPSCFPTVKFIDIVEYPEINQVFLILEYVDGGEVSDVILLKIHCFCPSCPLLFEQPNNLVISKHELWCPNFVGTFYSLS